MSEEPITYDCPRCGTPLAFGVERCPLCGLARGAGAPSPFTLRWWGIYVAVFIALVAAVATIAFAVR